MRTFPESPRPDFLQWCQTHAPLFTAHAAAIGLTPAQATAFNTAYTAGAASVAAQDAARAAAKNATAAATTAMSALHASAGDTVRLIRAFAEVQAKPDTVYQLASIPAPLTPSPAPPPAQPTNLTVTLDATTGQLTLRWKASNPVGTSGTSYIIRRKVNGAGPFAILGTSTSRKRFVDAALPAGSDSVEYTVQGQRSDTLGPVSGVCMVYFGQTSGGQMTASIREEAAGLSGSTVNGRSVQKVLPTGNGYATRV